MNHSCSDYDFGYTGTSKNCLASAGLSISNLIKVGLRNNRSCGYSEAATYTSGRILLPIQTIFRSGNLSEGPWFSITALIQSFPGDPYALIEVT